MKYMLYFHYESGNDAVAFSQKNIVSKVNEYIAHYEKDPLKNNHVLISQVDMINAIGVAIHEGKINYAEVSVVIDELDKQFLFDVEGALTDFWYSSIPDMDY